MGFFGKLFEKKECNICGGEIGLLGNRKLEDGNMCKHCAAKLSPWFSDRRSSTLEEIKEQLAYREANKKKVAAFHTTRTLGERTKILLDEDARVFVVTSARNLEEDNPDVLAFTDVTGCVLDISDRRTEETYQNKEGKQVSYNPPRYTYYYDFYIELQVRNPYFDEIRFRLNSSSVEIEDRGGPVRPGMGRGRFSPAGDPEYRRYQALGEEIREIMLHIRQQARDEIVAAAAPKASVTCPYCGATTTPNASGCCEFCGGAVRG